MLLKKISTKTVLGDVRKVVKDLEDGQIVDLMTVYGRAQGFKQGSSDFGDWLAFTGQFEVINLLTGETSEAPQVFLVEPLQGMLLAQLQNAESVDFAVTLQAVVDSEMPRGYEYRVVPLTETKRTDALDSLRALVHTKLPAIEHKGDAPQEVKQEPAPESQAEKPSKKK